MNKMFAIATAFASLAAATSAQAQSADAGAGAKIIAPLEISNVTDLYFGTIAPSTTVADKVVVLADGMEVEAARLEHGLLHVELRRPEESRAVRTIPIQAA